MTKIRFYIKWIMLVSGLLTATMLYGLFAPQDALVSMFGVSFDGELQNIIIRSWSALVGLMGLMLVYGFFNSGVRGFSIAVVAISKFVFVMLILLYGESVIAQLTAAIVMDAAVVGLAVVYFLSPASADQS